MERRRVTREFKLEAARLIRDRGISYAQASEDLKVHPTLSGFRRFCCIAWYRAASAVEVTVPRSDTQIRFSNSRTCICRCSSETSHPQLSCGSFY